MGVTPMQMCLGLQSQVVPERFNPTISTISELKFCKGNKYFLKR